MFKKTLLSTAAVSALCLAAPAQADNLYLSVFGGGSSADGSLSVGPFSHRAATTWTFSTTTLFGSTSDQIAGTGAIWPYTIVVNDSATLFYYGDFSTVGRTRVGGVEDELDTGFVVGAALGADFQDGWRAELEVAYRQYDLGDAQRLTGTQAYFWSDDLYESFIGTLYFHTTYPGTPTKTGVYTSGNPFVRTTHYYYLRYQTDITVTAHTDGEVSAFSLMANLWYDFDLGDDIPLTPFVGGGIGVAKLDVEYSGSVTFPTNTLGGMYTFGPYGASFSTDADDYVFAWQVGAGLSYEFGNGMTLSAQYRYFATGDISVMGQDFGVEAHEVLIGFSIPFGN